MNVREHPLYNTWRMMLKRCDNPNYTHYQYYGGKGVGVCVRWYNFSNFVKDVGERPLGHTLDRIDGDGDYKPSNCRWADKQLQAINTKVRSDNKSGVKGVAWHNAAEKWEAYVNRNGRKKYLGLYDTLKEATLVASEARHGSI